MTGYAIRAYLVYLALLQIPGCTTVHVRELTWPGFAARKECGWWLFPMPKTVSFDYVSIRMDQKPAAFTLKMPNGDIVASKDLTRDKLKQYFSTIEPLSKTYAPETEHAEIQFDHGGMSFMFIGQTVNRIDVGSWFPLRLHPAGTRPSIGDADGKKFLAFPASEQQLIDFFGKPTKAETYLFDT